MLQLRAVEETEGSGAAALGQRYRSWIVYGDAAFQALEFRYVGVAVRKDGSCPKRRQSAFVPEMSVRKEELFGFCLEDGVVAHHRELEHHLVNLGVTVAAHGDDPVLQSVEHADDLDRIVEVRHAVARTVVEKVSEKDDLVVL